MQTAGEPNASAPLDAALACSGGVIDSDGDKILTTVCEVLTDISATAEHHLHAFSISSQATMSSMTIQAHGIAQTCSFVQLA